MSEPWSTEKIREGFDEGKDSAYIEPDDNPYRAERSTT